jgi:hypothetical protein
MQLQLFLAMSYKVILGYTLIVWLMAFLEIVYLLGYKITL